MVDEIESPQAPRQYLNQTQVQVVNTLRERGFPVLADAYGTAIKMIHLVKHPEILGNEFISPSMAACIVGHLSREVLAGLLRDAAKVEHVEHFKIFGTLAKLWVQNGFPVDGNVPNYKPETQVSTGDIVFPLPLVEFLSRALQQHHENWKDKADQIILLVRDVYGERSEESEAAKKMLEWLAESAFPKYAHLSPKIYGSEKRNPFEEVVQEFHVLEVLLIEYCRDYYDKEGELDEILSQTNG